MEEEQPQTGGRAAEYCGDIPDGMLMPEPGAEAVAGETDLFGIPVQKDLFGEAVEDQGKKSKNRRLR